MKKPLVLISAVAVSSALRAAQFQPAAGGYLDVAENWNGTGTMAIKKSYSGPFTLSTTPASMPEGSTSLSFRKAANVCDFGAGNELALGSVPLCVEYGGTMTLKSGKMTGSVFVQDTSAGTSDQLPGTLILDGPDVLIEPTEFAIRCYKATASAKTNRLEVTNGARLSMSGLTFNMFGGYNAGIALFTGVGSSLLAENLVMGAKVGEDATYDGWLDQHGVRRMVEFANNATGETKGNVTIGDVSGGNVFKVSDGATFTCGMALRFGPSADVADKCEGCTNKTLIVSGGTLYVGNELSTGRHSAYRGSRIEVTSGGRLAMTGGQTDAFVFGAAADGDFLSVSGEGSVLSLSAVRLFVGGRDGASNGNQVEVRDGGRIETGALTYLGYKGGRGNSLSLVSGGAFASTTNFYFSGPGSSLRVDGSSFAAAAVTVEEAAEGSSIVLGEGAAFTAETLLMKTQTVFVATGATVDVLQGFSFANESHVYLTNTVLRMCKEVKGGSFGCDNGALELHAGSCLVVTNRWVMTGDNFTIRLDDSTLEADIPNNWFITGAGTNPGTGNRTFVFEGARPGLTTSGTGFFLRGESVRLVFNLGAEGFPMDRAVVDVQGSGVFRADSKETNLIAVNVAADCPEGTYTLMRGTNAGTFLNADRYVLTCAEGRKARLIREDDSVSVKVKLPRGAVLVLR